MSRVRSWPFWDLPGWLSGYVALVVTAYAAAIVICAAAAPHRLRDLWMFALLVGYGLVTVEVSRRSGEQSGLSKDAQGMWYLALAVLLPPVYALLAPIPVVLWQQLRVRRGLVYRRVFSMAAVGFAIAAASAVFHAAAPALGAVTTAPGGSQRIASPLAWLALATASGVVRAVVNKALVAVPIKGSEPGTPLLAALALDRETLLHDVAELCIAVLVAFAVAQVPAALIFAVPFGMLLQRSVRHAQLVSEARVDGKTGLLNAAAWNREAITKIAQAVQSGAPLALALIDIDRFKRINDRYGHLAGDEVLRAVTGAIRAAHRASDVCGRFGGEEFVLLLPGTTAAGAAQIAERLRAGVAALRVPAGTAAGAGPAEVTVSVGVAALSPGCRQLTDLMAAADAALYYAKETGRNRVRLSPAAGGLPASGPAGLMTGQG